MIICELRYSLGFLFYLVITYNDNRHDNVSDGHRVTIRICPPLTRLFEEKKKRENSKEEKFIV